MTTAWLDEVAGHHPEELRLLVLSDLHVHHDEIEAVGKSNYARDMADHTFSNNPVSALYDLIERKHITVDFVVCPGDITDRAHPGALEHGWRLLNDIRNKVHAMAILSTPGNHDVDSRFQHSQYDARGVAIGLQPAFPVDSRALSDSFWTRHFCLVVGGNYRMLLINSAAYHGEGTSFSFDKHGNPIMTGSTPEYEHGRISPPTLDAIERRLKQEPGKPVNIAIFHHHPDRLNGAPFEADYSAMEGGRELTDMLSNPAYGRWLMIHGHKHLGAIHQPGSKVTPGPVAFCAASFGKTLPGSWPSGNQLYEIRILTSPRTWGLGVAARFTAYEWTRGGQGWEVASQSSHLPGSGGFGFLGDPAGLALEIEAALTRHSARELTLDEAAQEIPQLHFVAPASRSSLKHELTLVGVKMTFDPDDGEVSFRRIRP